MGNLHAHPVLFVNCLSSYNSCAWIQFVRLEEIKNFFANFSLSTFIKLPTTEPFFIIATAYLSKAFSGSFWRVNFSRTKGIQILLYLWYPMIWDTISYSWIRIMGNSSSCSHESIFDFSLGELPEILFITLKHSFFLSAVFFAFKNIRMFFFFLQFEHIV